MEPQHEYKNVPAGDHHDDDSSTEVESLVGTEKQWVADTFNGRGRRSKRNACIGILKASRWWVVIGLQLVIVGLLAKDQGLLRQLGVGSSRQSSSALEIGGDITGWGPHSQFGIIEAAARGAANKATVPTRVQTFKINQTFAPYNTSEFFKPETLQAWNELMPSTFPSHPLRYPS